MYIVIGIIFILLGVFAFLKQESIWKITEQWKLNYSDGPSDLYLFSAKFGAAIFILNGIAAVIVHFIL